MEVLLPIVDPISEWEWLAERCDLPRLFQRLSTNQIGAYRLVGSDAALILAVNTTKDTGQRALWALSLGGVVGRRPKDNLRLMGAALRDSEEIARCSDCKAIRIEPGTRPEWKPKLLPLFGFEPLTIEGVTIMQKVLTDGR